VLRNTHAYRDSPPGGAVSGTTDYSIAPDGSFTAPLLLSYPYARTVGPVYSRFLTGLRDGVVHGVRADDGRVLVPPSEFDPSSGRPLDEWVEVGVEGEVVSWSWQPTPLEGNPLQHPFAWALVRLDGADSSFLHAVDAGTSDTMRTGLRVRARWADERSGAIGDLVCFEPVEGSDVR
jgi:uncharacterized protein